MEKISLIFLLFLPLGLLGQKVEFEKRCRYDKLPSAMQESLQQLYGQLPKRAKFYKEYQKESYSYEAKFRYQGHCHSVEYNAQGQLEEIEIRKKWKKLKPQTKEQIRKLLKQQFKHYRILKLQLQFTGPQTALAKALQGQTANANQAYELVIKGKKENKKWQLWEFLFTTDGQILRQEQLIEVDASSWQLDY
ncbi:hypothetical protein PPO43_15665 [Saprospira sp. CCB-QB6]|uniref:hypothetical protein n=1 Tax=Saprospira sp. CCB-QB6 TaxID=3023936 RepID=UPI002349A7C7|nr:hypothetical protein [Saprospira sp. CCB-QB6]WCL81413.1 hypothetical protein PPO43_15665 [Saprospira sp. CCB-QB6]